MATRNIDPATGSVAMSVLKQSAYGTAQTLARAWPRMDKGVIVSADPWHMLESNRGDVSGGREPDAFYRGNIEPPKKKAAKKKPKAKKAKEVKANGNT